MTCSRRRLVRRRPALLIVAFATILAACEAPGPRVMPVPTASGDAPAGPALGPEGSAAAASPTAMRAAPLDAVPTACFGVGEDDCRRVRAEIATLLTPDDPPIRYVQVGPFGCPGGQRCPPNLGARDEGDVTLETADGAISFHVTMRGGILDARRQETFGVMLQPSTRPPLPAAGQPFTLGHCGLWSGIDHGGSWWDPVGYVDTDHGDAINAAAGTFVLVGPDRALFTSTRGLAVQLQRRDGDKYLPLCD